MTPASLSALDELIVLAVEATLDALGTRARHREEADTGRAPESLSVAGVIGFFGPLRGTLLIATSPDLFVLVGGAELSEAEVRDWAGELANLLLGDLKGRLYERDVIVHVSTPTAVQCPALAFGRTVAPDARAHAFETNGIPLWVRVDFDPSCDVDLKKARQDGQHAARAGDLFLF